MSGFTQLAIRTVHVVAMAALVGGAATVWWAAERQLRDLPELARTYEWVFWGALGVLVVTGIGNLAALGAPGPATRWGQRLLLKLGLVVAVVLGSGVRTVAVAQAPRDTTSPVLAAWCRRAYGLTTAALLGLVVLAEVVAHG